MTTTRILIKIGKNAATITDSATASGTKKTLKIPCVFEAASIRVEGKNADLGKTTQPGDNQIRTGATGGDTTNNAGVGGVWIDLPNVLAEKMARYFSFKDMVKQAKNPIWADADIVLKDLTYDNDHAADGTKQGTFGVLQDTNKLLIAEDSFSTTITDANFKDHFKFWNVKNDEEMNANGYVSSGNPNVAASADINNAFKEEIEAFEETETLLQTLETKYNGYTTTFADVAELDTDLASLLPYLGGMEGKAYKFDEAGNIDRFPGAAKSVATILNTERAAHPENVKILAKKALYDLGVFTDTANNFNKYYQKKINALILKINELKIWKEGGFNDIEEIVKANRNGYTISNRELGTAAATINPTTKVNICSTGGDKGQIIKEVKINNDGTFDLTTSPYPNAENNIKAATKKIKLYKVFGMTGADQVAETTSTNDKAFILNSKEFTASDPTKSNGIKYTRENLESFFSDNWFEKKQGDTPDYATLPESDFKNVRITRGFLPKDFIAGKTYLSAGHGDCLADNFAAYDGTGALSTVKTNEAPTKLCLDLIRTKSVDEAIDLAFFGKHFFKANSKYTKNDDRFDGENYKLFLDEVDGKDPEWHLNLYHGFLLANASIGAGSLYDEAADDFSKADDWSAGNFYNNNGTGATDPRGKAKAAYDAVKTFLGYCTKYETADKSDATKKTTWASNKTKLQEYKTKGSAWTPKPTGDWEERIGKYFAKQIGDLITYNDNIFTTGGPNNDKFSQDNINELAEKVTKETNVKAKAVYVEFQKLLKTDEKKIDGVYEQLKLIIAELIKTSHDKPGDLEKLGQTGDGKTAWDFIDTVEEAKDNGVGWAKSVLDKAKKELTEAITAVETEMSGEGDAVDKTTIKTVESITEARAIKELFALCKKAHGALTSTEAVDVISQLEGFSKGSGAKKAAWDKVDKYKKSGESEGFATISLKKAAEADGNNKQDFSDLLELPLAEIWPKFQAAKAAKKTGLDEWDAKRAMATVFLKDGDENEKKLSQIFSKKSTSEYKEDEANVDKSLTDIENDIKEIQKVINAKDSDPEGKIRIKLNTVANLGDAKAFLENWVSKLESRKKTLQQKSAGYKKNQENNKKQPTTGEPSFWTGPWGITIIAVGVLAVVGAIAYFIKANSSEETE